MSTSVALVVSCIVAYLLCGIPFGVILGKVLSKDKVDIRTKGSGNMGFTNAIRVAGAKVGVLTLLLDVAKAFVSITMARALIAPSLGVGAFELTIANNGMQLLAWVYLFCVLGHCFTPYLKFKGGKGIAVGLGGALAFIWATGLTIFAAFLVLAITTKKVSLGSIAAAALLPFVAAWYVSTQAGFLLPLALISLVVIWAHRSNIKKLLNGTESSFEIKKKDEA